MILVGVKSGNVQQDVDEQLESGDSYGSFIVEI